MATAPKLKRAKVELPCKGTGHGDMRRLAISILAKKCCAEGAGRGDYEPTMAEEQQCAAATAGLVEEARKLGAVARVGGCAGVLGDTKRAAPVDVGVMGTTELLQCLKQRSTGPLPATKKERLVVAVALAAADASCPTASITATMHSDPGTDFYRFHHRDCTRELVPVHAQGSGQCSHCRLKLRKVMIRRLETRMGSDAADPKDQNRRLELRGGLADKACRLQQDKKNLQKQVARLQKKVEIALAAHQDRDHGPRTEAQADVAHAIMQVHHYHHHVSNDLPCHAISLDTPAGSSGRPPRT